MDGYHKTQLIHLNIASVVIKRLAMTLVKYTSIALQISYREIFDVNCHSTLISWSNLKDFRKIPTYNL